MPSRPHQGDGAAPQASGPRVLPPAQSRSHAQMHAMKMNASECHFLGLQSSSLLHE